MRHFLALVPVLLLNACASAPAPDQDPARRALAAPIALVAESGAPDVILADPRAASTISLDASSPAGMTLASDDDVTAAERVVRAAASGLEIAPAVRMQLAHTVKTFSPMRLVPADLAASTLAIRGSAVGFEDGQYLLGSRVLYLVVQARWSEGDRLIQERAFVYRSSERPVAAWTGAATSAELKAAYAQLGERIAEELLMPAGLAPAAGSACGLQWVAPRRLYRPPLGAAPSEWNRFILLDTRTPTLAWEPLADYAQRAGGEAVGETARDVRYDLRVWQALRGAAPLLMYERQGLPGTEHTIEMPLRADTRYYWSVRARFTAADGSTGVTTWGRFRLPYAALSPAPEPDAGQGLVRDPCLVDFMAEPNYYRFATPADAAK